MADHDTAVAIFESAGFTNVELTKLNGAVTFRDAAEAANFHLDIGPAGEVMRHASERNHPGVIHAKRTVGELFESLAAPHGLVLKSAFWWLRGRA